MIEKCAQVGEGQGLSALGLKPNYLPRLRSGLLASITVPWIPQPDQAALEARLDALVSQFVTLASESRFMAARAAEEVSAVRKTGVKAGTLPAY